MGLYLCSGFARLGVASDGRRWSARMSAAADVPGSAGALDVASVRAERGLDVEMKSPVH